MIQAVFTNRLRSSSKMASRLRKIHKINYLRALV
jgi:hypothetical protein